MTNPERAGRRRDGRNRVAVENILRTNPQGGSCVATLGFGTESRWDSQTGARRRRRGHDAVRAQLDLPDFFKNLAGNHAAKELEKP